MKNTFEQLALKQGWNIDSKVNILLSFIKSVHGTEALDKYAINSANIENSELLEDTDGAALDINASYSYEDIKSMQGWNIDSEFYLLREFITKNDLDNKLYVYAKKFN